MNDQNFQNQQPPKQIQIKAQDADLKGIFANAMQITHTREEFVLDFLNIFPPQGTLNARIITTPGHLKRIVLALQDNLKKYENTFGEIEIADMPKNEVGFGERA
ncbi:MAG TPA: DUF3467 domain-containing protein [Candidatus Bipolaricaulota bacterium]|nr:DUF3467 domain-containing protein [Candidatus Bipolaricaulota bacterium]